MHEPLNPQISQALDLATYTKHIRIGHGAIGELPHLIRHLFPAQHAVIIADENTWQAAGQRAYKILRDVNLTDHSATPNSLILPADQLHAEIKHVEHIQQFLSSHPNTIPIAVGAGTINDLTKLAASNIEQPYICLPTAASVDGFTSYNASIEIHGHKQTVFCPAPLAVIADLDIICAAPQHLNAAGFGDLLAKYPASVDWTLADAANIEPIDPIVWNLTHDHLAEWTSNPLGIQKADNNAIRNLFNGLIVHGISMDIYQGTRPCSGAEHQISHLLDMANHRHHNLIPLHGIKVGIGSIAMSKLHDILLNTDLSNLQIDDIVHAWSSLDTFIAQGQALFDNPTLKHVVSVEYPLKYQSRDSVLTILTKLKSDWPNITARAKAFHIPPDTLKQKLADAGCPTHPKQISLSLEQTHALYKQAYFTRSRFTALDIATMLGQLDNWTQQIFSQPW